MPLYLGGVTMRTLNIDIETYSSEPIKSGVYKYVEAPDFEILIIAYSINGGEVEYIDLLSNYDIDKLEIFKSLLTDKDCTKIAFNANFERVCLGKYLGVYMNPKQWKCTRVDSLRLGLPSSLEKVAEVLKVDAQKDKTGKNLIRYFSLPCKATKANGGRTRNLPEHDLEKWRMFIDYCVQDVRTEMAVRDLLNNFDYPDFEQELWALDQEINDRGVQLDLGLMKGAVECDEVTRLELLERAKTLTGLTNPNSNVQLLEWLRRQGVEADNLQKFTVVELSKKYENTTVGEVLKIKLELAKSSVKKYKMMETMACQDERVHGILEFYGASKTGRWAGRGVQVQNLTKHYMSDDDLQYARKLITDKDYDLVDMFYKESRQNILSQLVRTTFIPKSGHKFVVYDFSAIEARVIAWFSKEQWRLEVFSSHGKIYEASASQMFKVPIETIGKGSPLRQKGKVAELALGYQGGAGALVQMGALNMGISEDELPAIVKAWRESNKNVVKFWYNAENAAKEVIRNHNIVETNMCKFFIKKGCLRVQLPSGRYLSYVKPRVIEDAGGRSKIVHQGVVGINWSQMDTYGGKLVENIVQATARDCLALALLRLDKAGYKCVMHVHDEIVLEVPEDDNTAMDKVKEIMNEPIPWAKGLKLDSAGFESKFYMKD